MVKSILINIEDITHKEYLKEKGDVSWKQVVELGINELKNKKISQSQQKQ
jgi:hypothetical protein